jgi:hypothetical protein
MAGVLLRGPFVAGLADQGDRVHWEAGRISRAQRNGLRVLVQHAVEHSPFHRKRLAGVDVDRIDPADLSALPVMTKAQMMDDLDDVFTDRRLNRVTVEAALSATRADPVPILDEYVALASGGCSGRAAAWSGSRRCRSGPSAPVAAPGSPSTTAASSISAATTPGSSAGRSKLRAMRTAVIVAAGLALAGCKDDPKPEAKDDDPKIEIKIPMLDGIRKAEELPRGDASPQASLKASINGAPVATLP